MSVNSVHRLHSEEEVHGYAALFGANGYHASDAPQPEAGHDVSEELCWQKFYEHPNFKYERPLRGEAGDKHAECGHLSLAVEIR